MICYWEEKKKEREKAPAQRCRIRVCIDYTDKGAQSYLAEASRREPRVWLEHHRKGWKRHSAIENIVQVVEMLMKKR